MTAVSRHRTQTISTLLLVLAATAAGAQNADSLRKVYMLPLPKTIEIAASAARSAPGSSAGSPSAYGANFGDGFIGASFQLRTRGHSMREPFTQRSDGAVVGGLGLGNSRDYLGLEVAITSFSTVRSGFGKSDGVSFKIHRVLPKNFGIAAGWENAIVIGGTDGGQSLYGVISSVFNSSHPGFPFFKSVTLSAGAGAGRFRRERDVRSGRKTINPFGSIGLRILSPISLIADYTGQDITVGASIVPFVRIPLALTPAFADVAHLAGDGARFTMGVGMGFRFAQIKDFLAPND